VANPHNLLIESLSCSQGGSLSQEAVPQGGGGGPDCPRSTVPNSAQNRLHQVLTALYEAGVRAPVLTP